MKESKNRKSDYTGAFKQLLWFFVMACWIGFVSLLVFGTSGGFIQQDKYSKGKEVPVTQGAALFAAVFSTTMLIAMYWPDKRKKRSQHDT
ncbi:hypothetical protein IQ13_0499 [Lacibacter cauensis]|uniref:Uncharacterized protein n=1 Tax=Lacibacter cauensis TaxID=510947 RepID=A0A562SVL5_9BACT|nr:hypothetical protein [Lacibacter cauensis]TWI85339.1 hypothetical protein IQ13_0499 [Lacibacter cauensis]